MLKIKESVDLKELEKFGFLKEKNKNRYSQLLMSKDGNDYYVNILANREITFKHYSSDYRKLNEMSVFGIILFDLIKADLVEKVGE